MDVSIYESINTKCGRLVFDSRVVDTTIYGIVFMVPPKIFDIYGGNFLDFVRVYAHYEHIFKVRRKWQRLLKNRNVVSEQLQNM